MQLLKQPLKWDSFFYTFLGYQPANKLSFGFTLFELMIVLIIMSILLATVLPGYRNYTNKAKFVEVIQAAAPYKLAVTLCVYEQGNLAACGTPGVNGLPSNFVANSSKSSYVHKIQLSLAGKITVYSQKIQVGELTQLTYILTPTYHIDGQITWKKSGTCLEQGIC